MSNLIILNTREVKKIKEALRASFGTALEKDYAYLRNEKDRVFIINKDLGRIDLKNLKIDRIGLYFAEFKNGQIRLSKEGAQLLVREAEGKMKNTVKLSEGELRYYFLGSDLEKDLGEENRLILLEYNQEIVGCAKYKDGKVLNFLPKIHRGEVIV